MNAILRSQGGEEIKPDSNWMESYLVRHHDVLQAHWSRPLDTQHAQALNPEAVRAWFQLLKEFTLDLDICAEDIYGMDESGFPPSDQGTQQVLGHRGTKTQHKQGGADRENVTAIITICTDGTTLCPTIIFKGQNMMAKWGDNNESDTS
ncbi:hypothetical protein ARMSODRAFT_1026033 [Armillaria solidipes]|uniref:DDE-1 domain-containing protein n=1 Tax=Armillaria solidipes TaxID=1076256 RepID=A0A2H3AW41_9AGAR|nr:hypothetical protein ARMSODRAFT_1026033 [Armillaria solidipes]